jgi:hypothetical protein
VSGSKKPAIDGQLIILAAGDEGLFKECATAFDIMVGWLLGHTLGELVQQQQQQQQQPCVGVGAGTRGYCASKGAKAELHKWSMPSVVLTRIEV